MFGDPLEVDGPEAIALVRALVSHGCAVWIVAKGHSMMPTIMPGALVRVEPLHRKPQCGDVLLVVGSSIEPAHLHRVRHVERESLIMRGDNMLADDPPTDVSAVIGIATAASIGGGIVVIGGQPPTLARRLMTRVRTRIRRWGVIR